VNTCGDKIEALTGGRPTLICCRSASMTTM